MVTETASQGTPAVVYDVDGLRDAVTIMETGIVVSANINALTAGVSKLLTEDKLYEKLRQNAWELSRTLDFKSTCDEFLKHINTFGTKL